MVHRSGMQLRGEVDSAATAALQEAQADFHAAQKMTYDKLLQSVMVQGEELLMNRGYFEFKGVRFLDEAGKELFSPKAFTTVGRAYVTQRRIILISAQNVKDLSAGYSVDCTIADARRFMSVAHKSVRSLALTAGKVHKSKKLVGFTPNKMLYGEHS
eukprot:gene33752-22885_t